MDDKQPKYNTRRVLARYKFIGFLFGFFGLVILFKAAYLMTVDRDYWLAVNAKFESEYKPLPATRGNILSADGQLLATSLPEYRIFLDPMSWERDPVKREKDQKRRDSILTHCMDSIVNGMHQIIPDLDPQALRRRIIEGRRKKKHNIALYSQKRVTHLQLLELKKLPLFRLSVGMGGFRYEEFRRRKNPYGNLAARTVGKLRSDNDSALSGLELAFDTELSGRPGVCHREKVSNRYIDVVDTTAEDGCDVVTTLDVSMQDLTEKVLGDQLRHLNARAGMCILMEVATGDVKAISSLSRLSDGSYAEIEPRAVTNMMEPGSVFKPMSFMVAMDDGKITMNSTYDTGSGVKDIYGRKMRDADWRKGGNGVMTVPEIIKRSSNVGVSGLIDRAYGRDPDKFVEGLQRIGIMEDLHIPIPGYRVPRIRYKRDNAAKWYGTTLSWMSIGYETQVPPISTLTFYNGVANGGKLVQPRFVTEIRRNDEVIKEFPVVVLREKMCKDQTLRDIQTCLEGVIGKNSGTGKAAYSKYFRMAGKTGTAQIWSKHGFAANYLVSFAGYFPADRPKYSMIVCIEKTAPAYGGAHCGPVFKKIAETVMARDLNPDYRTARDSTEQLHSLPFMAAGNLNALNNVLTGIGMGHQGLPVTASGIVWGYNAGEDKRIILSQEAASQGMPSLIGYGLRDAVYRLERMGLRVKATGVGHVVRQSIAPGTKVQRGMRVGLLLSLNDDRHLSENEDLAFRRMYGLPIEKKDSTQKTADSSRTAAVKSEHSVVSNSDNKKTKPTPANHSGTSEKNKEQKSGSSSTSKSTASTSKGSASSSSSSASKNNKNEASSNKKTPKGSKS
mgnify:FL=1|jgi:penicillin-binding protein 2